MRNILQYHVIYHMYRVCINSLNFMHNTLLIEIVLHLLGNYLHYVGCL